MKPELVKYKYPILIFGGLLLLALVLGISLREVKTPDKNTSNLTSITVKSNNNPSMDDTKNIQNAINLINEKGGGTVKFSKGTYYIDALQSLHLRSNVTLDFDKGVILKALPNSSSSYEIIRINNVTDVTLNGHVNIIGDRKEHQGNTGEWGMGISIKGSNNITINDVRISDCWGDGIYIGSSDSNQTNTNISINNPVLDNNRRQGISVISAINLKIVKPYITNTNGTKPASGIDLEPNNKMERMQNISILNPSTKGNQGYGFILSLEHLRGSKFPVSIYVNDTSKLKDGFKIYDRGDVVGKITVGKEFLYILKEKRE
ncbi:right-handed parallel beta-helix repeat-containing protein [Priestia aryabhattai]|uniref:right-handed parallel beta-helix repeat-containing protein n=1 Tax=Priestia aryabhattai TaxID=412384 RepID=UPI003567FBD8